MIAQFGKDIRKEAARSEGIVPLSARVGWTDMGLAVHSGQTVHIEGEGTWSVSPKYGLRDADGVTQRSFFDYRIYKHAKLGALLCRVVESDKIYAGKSLHFMADRDGNVYCRVNDRALGNNEGIVSVHFIR